MDTRWTTDPHTYVDFVRDGNARSGEASELRLCEQWAARPQSVFQFDVQGQAATSTHAGLPWLLWLREMFAAKPRPHDAFSGAAWLAEMDRRGTLDYYFKPRLSRHELRKSRLEGWILGVC